MASSVFIGFPNATYSGGTLTLNGVLSVSSSAVTSTVPLLFSADNTHDIGASGATRPRNLYVAGTTLSPAIYLGSSLTFGGGAAPNGSLSTILSPSNGLLQVTDNAGTGFTRLILGTNDTSGAAVAKNGTTLQAVTGDASVFVPWQSLYQRFGAGSPEGVITAPVGAIYNRSDGGAGTSFYVKESGAGNTGWVAK